MLRTEFRNVPPRYLERRKSNVVHEPPFGGPLEKLLRRCRSRLKQVFNGLLGVPHERRKLLPIGASLLPQIVDVAEGEAEAGPWPLDKLQRLPQS